MKRILTVVVALAFSAACGVLLTEAPAAGDSFDEPIDGLTALELAAFVEGDVQFGKTFSPANGLGPIFNDNACAACHSGDGRGRKENALTRFSIGLDPAYAYGGPQLQHRAIAGAEAEFLPPGMDVSVRLPPPVAGAGLIEAIPESAILANVDSLDANGDGVSGRPNWVTPAGWVPETEPGAGPARRVGRFSRKAQVSSIFQQTTEAYYQDMGITSDFLSVENHNPHASRATHVSDRVGDPEIPAATVHSVVNYLRMLAAVVPGTDTPQRQQGATLFQSVGCAACHVPELRTGPSRVGALANRPVRLFSDLLLHDMGPGLADNRPDGSATGREWRTEPLWGLRLMRQFLNGDAFLLHDGRAGSVEEAILLHGGEGQGARDRFNALTAADRAALLDFVESR